MTDLLYYEKTTKQRVRFDTILLGFYLLLLPLDFIKLFDGSVSKFVALLPIGMTILMRLSKLKVHTVDTWILLFYLFLNYVSTSYAYNFLLAKQRGTSLLLNYMMIIICSAFTRNKRETEFLKKSMVLSGWFVLGMMLLFRKEIGGRLIVEIGGEVQDPNYMCGYLMFAWIYYIDRLVSKKNTLISVVGITFILLGTFLSGSRGGLLALTFGGLVYLLCSSNSGSIMKKIATTMLICVVVIFIFSNFVPDDIKNRYSIEFAMEDRGAGRLDIWKSIINNYKNFSDSEKLFGKGAANVRYYANGQVAHNIWIETLCELGIVGLFVLAVIYIRFIKHTYKLKDKLYFSVLMGYIAMTMTMSLYVYKPIFAIFIMIYIVGDNEKLERKIFDE